MAYYLGVDAGGTKAEFVLGDDNAVLSRVRTGTIKRLRANEATTEANLLNALAQLTQQTGIVPHDIACCCIGTAGDTVPLVTDWLKQAFGRHVGGRLVIVSDVEVALDAAFCGRRGVLVLAGTGSNVAGRTSGGKLVNAGGWGPALAEQGSGHFIGLEALRRGFMALDCERPTRLLERAQDHWKLKNLGELIELGNSQPQPDFSSFAPIVVEAAQAGDAEAQAVLEQGGRELAQLAGIAIDRIQRIEAEAGQQHGTPPVAVAGSILEHVATVRQTLETELRQRYPSIEFVERPADPPLGALWGARNR